jgi:glycosyltransferase involved in cell wall biosynthesis
VCRNGAPAWTPRSEPPGVGPILHVGTVEPRKNVAALIKAYVELVRQYPAAPDLVLAGRVEELPGDLVTGDDKMLSQRVRTPGYVTEQERLRLYGEASMLVIASSDEGFGLPAVEAMTIGLPVVASNRGALPEVVADAGVLADPDDRSAFASAMRKVLENPSLRRDLAARGIARARTFDWDESAAKARQALASAVGRRQGRA